MLSAVSSSWSPAILICITILVMMLNIFFVDLLVGCVWRNAIGILCLFLNWIILLLGYNSALCILYKSHLSDKISKYVSSFHGWCFALLMVSFET
jgi:hypothetical protein